VGSYSHALFCQVMSASVPRGHDVGRAYLVMKASECLGWTPRPLMDRGKNGDGQIGTDALLVSSNVVVQKSLTRITPGFSILGGWPILFSQEWFGLYPIRGIGFPRLRGA
jgi:hypothetical protein